MLDRNLDKNKVKRNMYKHRVRILLESQIITTTVNTEN